MKKFTSPMLPVTCHLSPDNHYNQLQLLCKPRRLGHVATGGLLISKQFVSYILTKNKTKSMSLFLQFRKEYLWLEFFFLFKKQIAQRGRKNGIKKNYKHLMTIHCETMSCLLLSHFSKNSPPPPRPRFLVPYIKCITFLNIRGNKQSHFVLVSEP